MSIDPIAALGAVANALVIVDSVARQWARFFQKKPEAEVDKEYSVTAARVAPDTIRVRSSRYPEILITADDMAKLIQVVAEYEEKGKASGPKAAA